MEKRRDLLDSLKLGDRIRKYREEHNWTQEDFAQMLDISSGYVSQIERGQHIPSMVTFVTICKVLNIEPNMLLFDSLPSQTIEESYKRIQLNHYLDNASESQLDALLRLFVSFEKKE